MRLITWALSGLALLLLIGIFCVFAVAPRLVDASMNRVVDHPPWPVSAEAAALHAQIGVADLHADTLLWQRNPARRHHRGHTDLPRLREGGMFLQVFTTVTKSPAGLNYERNEGTSDQITLLAIVQRWPRASWGSLYQRAVYQAQRLHHLAADDPGLRIIRTRDDLIAAEIAHAGDPTILAAILGTEGAHPLEGRIENVEGLYKEGFRVIGLQHFFDNELGGSLHGVSQDGLSPFGADVVDALTARAMIIDVAHSSPQVVRDVLARTTRPVIVSHTGLAGLCPGPRNIPDALMESIAARGGLIGIGFWDEATCDATPAGIARMVRYGIDLLGEDAIALGSDFDGSVTAYFDASELAALTHAMLDEGLSPDQIRKVMGDNAVRFFRENLPRAEDL